MLTTSPTRFSKLTLPNSIISLLASFRPINNPIKSNQPRPNSFQRLPPPLTSSTKGKSVAKTSSSALVIISSTASNIIVPLFVFVLLRFTIPTAADESRDPWLGSGRVVFQTKYGDIEFGFYSDVAPKTVERIFRLVRLGGYNTNHFFRVDKGFVAQVADVASGRSAPMNEEQRAEAEKKIVGEFCDVKHVRVFLSMGRYEDPNSAQSSFSILLGNAPHLDGQHAIFGKVTKGDETLRKLEKLPTRHEGIFVLPTERITIHLSYYYDTELEVCEEENSKLRRRLAASAIENERQ